MGDLVVELYDVRVGTLTRISTQQVRRKVQAYS